MTTEWLTALLSDPERQLQPRAGAHNIKGLHVVKGTSVWMGKWFMFHNADVCPWQSCEGQKTRRVRGWMCASLC